MLKVKIKKFTVAFGAAVAVAACCLSVAFGANAETIKSDTSGTAAVRQDEEGARTVTVSSGGNGSKALFQKAKLNQKRANASKGAALKSANKRVSVRTSHAEADLSTSTSSTTSKQTSSPNPPDSLLEKTTSTYPWFDYPGFVNYYSAPGFNIKNWNSAQGALQVRAYLPAGTVFSYQYAQNQPSQGFDPPFTSDSAIKSYFDNAMSEGSVGSNGIEIQNSNDDGFTYLFGGINAEGEQATILNVPDSNKAPYQSVEQAFINACTSGELDSYGYAGGTTPAECLEEFNNQATVSYTGMHPVYKMLVSPQLYGEYYTGPNYYGCANHECYISVTLGTVLLQYLESDENAPWNENSNNNNDYDFEFFIGSSTNKSSTSSDPVFSANGATVAFVDRYGDGSWASASSETFQHYGNTYDNFYDDSDQGLANVNFDDPSTVPAGTAGLWFKVKDRSGKPVNRVEISLDQFTSPFGSDVNGGLNWNNVREWGYSPVWPGTFLMPYWPLVPAFCSSSSYSVGVAQGTANSQWCGWSPLNVNGDAFTFNSSKGTNTALMAGDPIEASYNWGYENPGSSSDASQLTFTLPSIPNHPGVFALSGLPAGTYKVKVWGYSYSPTGAISPIDNGSYYSAPQFVASLGMPKTAYETSGKDNGCFDNQYSCPVTYPMDGWWNEGELFGTASVLGLGGTDDFNSTSGNGGTFLSDNTFLVGYPYDNTNSIDPYGFVDSDTNTVVIGTDELPIPSPETQLLTPKGTVEATSSGTEITCQNVASSSSSLTGSSGAPPECDEPGEYTESVGADNTFTYQIKFWAGYDYGSNTSSLASSPYQVIVALPNEGVTWTTGPYTPSSGKSDGSNSSNSVDNSWGGTGESCSSALPSYPAYADETCYVLGMPQIEDLLQNSYMPATAQKPASEGTVGTQQNGQWFYNSMPYFDITGYLNTNYNSSDNSWLFGVFYRTQEFQTGISSEGNMEDMYLSPGSNANEFNYVAPAIYTNGPSSNAYSAYNFSTADPSSQTGLWWQSLWQYTTTPAAGATFEIQGPSGQYLTPDESGGDFTGWSYSSTPYVFSTDNADAYFAYGGLANGTYTITQLSQATGALKPPYDLKFSMTLKYSIPEHMQSLHDVWDLLGTDKNVVYQTKLPPATSVPLTGGNGELPIIVGFALILILGGFIFFLIFRRVHR